MLDLEKDSYGDDEDSSESSSQATILIQDIVTGIIQNGTPPYPSSMFVDEGFRWFEPKKKERTLGDCPLWFPKNCYVGVFTDNKYQFCSRGSLLEFLEDLGAQERFGPEDDPTYDVYDIIGLVKEKFPDCPIGVAGADKEYLAFWSSEKDRNYYSVESEKIVEIEPKVIVV